MPFVMGSNNIESNKQLQLRDGGMDAVSSTVGNNHMEECAEREESTSQFEDYDNQLLGVPYSDCSMDGLKLSGGPDDLEENQLNEEFCLASETSQIIVDTIESDFPSNNREGESLLSEPKWLEGDHALALWVKWRGKWQTGIRCARADWPLTTLKGKPTHERKKYFVIFFPHTKNYSWVDMHLVRPIDEFPEPIAYRSHKIGLKWVKELAVARRFIMQRLAVGMLNIVDQLHVESLTEASREMLVWKEFAKELSQCTGYDELGKMLLKLQNMILSRYLNLEWLQQDFNSWTHRCCNAHSAEIIETLKEELFENVLWKEVNSLWNGVIQGVLGSEWRTWKHDIIKWFSTAHELQPVSNVVCFQQHDLNHLVIPSIPVMVKRPKLEVRRAEVHTSQLDARESGEATNVMIDSAFFNNEDTANGAALTPKPHVGENAREGTDTNVTDRWDKIVVEGRSVDLVQSRPIEPVHPNELTVTPVVTPRNISADVRCLDSGSRSRQCAAFVESKQRQCNRSANEGEVYCCIHLASRYAASSVKMERPLPVETPPCEGTTVLGTRCKHRSLPGFSFCKKHRPEGAKASDSMLKRKHEDLDSHSEGMIGIGTPSKEASYFPHVDRASVFMLPTEKREHSGRDSSGLGLVVHCLGSCFPNEECMDSPIRCSLYCDRHLPSWLKRARNGKSRILSKEVFLEILGECSSLEKKRQLHRACELFFRLFKSVMSVRNPVPMDVQFQWALSEASKDPPVGELLTKLVCSEKERLQRIWGCGAGGHGEMLPLAVKEPQLLLTDCAAHDDVKSIKCNICLEEFPSALFLGNHWLDRHRKDAQRLFKGYACAICFDSCTDKKVLETHVQDRHRVQFVEHCKLLQCIPCGSHFGNSDELWSHVLSVHTEIFISSKVVHQPILAVNNLPSKHEPSSSAPLDSNLENMDEFRKFVCRFCGMRFDLLPDLGRHHQADHMGPGMVGRPPKRGLRFSSYKLKTGRLSRPRFKSSLGAASYRIRSRANVSLRKHIGASKMLSFPVSVSQPHPMVEPSGNSSSKLAEADISVIAQILYSHIQKTKGRPNNYEVLSIARCACCKENIKALLEAVYGVLPERLYLKAAKMCSEQNIPVNWHLDGFVCPKGCQSVKQPTPSPELTALPEGQWRNLSENASSPLTDNWEVDESHCVIDLHQLKPRTMQNAIILCDDISFGLESVQVSCVVDEWLLDLLHVVENPEDNNAVSSMPWERFTYVTKPIHTGFVSTSLQLGCSCTEASCAPEKCDHVYLFDNDYQDAKDIDGKPMHGRFPYDEYGRLILEGGYLIYECNRMCGCSKSCPNRVLQNGVRVKLEVFRTEKKGWAVRAAQAISRGMFICEYVGEVLGEADATERRKSDGAKGYSYIYDISSGVNEVCRLTEENDHHVIDAAKYGNVSRFINHSCSPNLVSHQVLLESMDSHRAHVGLYADRDIALGEELTYEYNYKVGSEEACPCLCGSTNCRGRVH
ncbi:hypothetical protein MLD38_031202 [Melastoma candidum]|uniref:Uncharacterized protein n=1 Tax=Melastoma candidum TaxID=119954 RepID=A0ACB9MNZ7_9MYRT|nr:hypothetical protein MLD38_031202 [Melastoma candidum]